VPFSAQSDLGHPLSAVVFLLHYYVPFPAQSDPGVHVLHPVPAVVFFQMLEMINTIAMRLISPLTFQEIFVVG
jgi:hypothetical protein